MEFNKEYFDFFEEEINKYAAGVNFLNPGIEDEYIEKAEEKLGVKLPEEYKAFLRIYNGGEIFSPGTVFSEVYINPDDRVRGGSYLNDVLGENYRPPELPDNLLEIATMNFGDIICIDMDNSEDIAKIVQWDHETGEIYHEWDSFKDFLLCELESGEMLREYNGNRKNFTL